MEVPVCEVEPDVPDSEFWLSELAALLSWSGQLAAEAAPASRVEESAIASTILDVAFMLYPCICYPVPLPDALSLNASTATHFHSIGTAQ